MKQVKQILFLLMIFLFFAFLVWFMWETQVFNPIQLLLFVGMGVGAMVIGIIWIWTQNKDGDCDHPDIYTHQKECKE